MAIFGAGSKWDDVVEKKYDFFKDENFVIGWDYLSAKDLYVVTGTLKVGDIIYLKANKPGSKIIRVKGIGIVTQNFVDFLLNEDIEKDSSNLGKTLAIKVKWIVKDEFKITIPANEGKLTNVRAATFYEEYLPLINSKIITKILSRLK